MIHKLFLRTYMKMALLILCLSVAFSTVGWTSTGYAADIEAPQNLIATERTHDSVTLSWDLVDGVSSDDGYNVWNATTGDWLAWAGAPPKVIGGLSAETEYSYYVTPGRENDKKSNIVTVKTDPADPNAYPKPPLSPPHNLKITDITDTSVTLSWGGSPSANGYDMYVNGGWKAGIWDGSNTYTFPVGAATVTGAVYTFEVAAQLMPAVSAKSNSVTLTWGQLQAPQDLKIVTATRTTASLGWALTPGATGYDIFLNDALVGSSESNRYVATGLTEGQAYKAKVVAKNKLWQSPASNEKTVVPGSDYNIVTYYTSWSVYERDYDPSDMDVAQITHINYAFADLCWRGFGSGGLACQNEDIPLQADYVFDGEIVVGDQEVDLRNMANLRSIRTQHPHLNLMVSVGGWSWSKNFSNMAATEETRRAFANSAVEYLREYRLDGLDIDWEYPVEGGLESNSRSPDDKKNFVLLIQTVREALDAAGSVDNKYYLLTIASAQSDAFVANADLARSSEYLDFINIMTYDYAGTWENLAHHNAPLYHDKNHPKASAPRNNVSAAALGHLNGGIPHHKLVLGVPFYGFGLIGCPPNGQYAACEGGTIPSGEQFGTWEPYAFAFFDIEDNYLNKNGYVRYWNEAAKVPYLYNKEKQRFISYDDEESMMYKASLIKTLNLAGVMSWDVSQDRNRTLSSQLARDLSVSGAVYSPAVAAPSNLTVKSIGSNSARVAWEASKDASGYDVLAGHTWIGYTTQTEYDVPNLTPSTAYKIQVIAVRRDGDKLKGVSTASSINLTTSSGISGYSGGGGGGGGSPAHDPNGTAEPGTNPLKAKISMEGSKAIFTLDIAQAVKSIQASSFTTSQIVVSTDAAKTETLIAKEVIQAIVAKGEQASLSLIVNQVEYRILVKALKLADNIVSVRITMQAPDRQVTDDFKSAARANGITVLVDPLEFIVATLASDGKAIVIESFGSTYVSRIFKINQTAIHTERATGVVYVPGNKAIYSVPTIFTKGSDGTVKAELKRTGNSIYAIVESNPSFPDANSPWAKQDIESAASKFIVSGASKAEFGAKHNITRAEFVSIIVKALGILPVAQSSPFKDVNDETKFADEIIAAWKLGFIKGKSADAFDPTGFITRQEMAAVLAKAMAYAGYANKSDLSVLASYADGAQISAFAKESMAIMVSSKIMNGVSPTKLDPLSKVTKEQATVTAMRMLRALNLSN
ncbi:glycosyl hydrolase family 18 protein [Cohnella cholangitidis]|uniref:chitinase n=1 Tax=Cohnella cholangitidis TaxID=2598458 RepID=A0A7G5C241_9BACL|nr:glycosyl hydrolase family 18 protein [Cohnella cholangitidis]QMV43275.1 glycoside hydrolase [Cohnella cholangitidis]